MSDQETDVIITVGELAHDRVIGKINLDISGASTAFVNGYCQEKMEIDLSGASTLKAANLNAQSVSGQMSGASDADVTVCSSLNVELSGASTLIYGTVSDECDPIVNCNTSGGSTVRSLRRGAL